MASFSANNNVDDMTRPDYLQRADAGDVKSINHVDSTQTQAHTTYFHHQTTLQKTLFDFPFPAQLQHKAI
jgi:hypothetical protein